MGTHPIFESDFDCLTGLRKFGPVKVFKWIEDEVFGAELQTRYILLEKKNWNFYSSYRKIHKKSLIS